MGGMTAAPDLSPTQQAALDGLVSSGGVPMLPGVYMVDTLPDPSANLTKLARVSDLFGAKLDVVVASQVGALSFWQPMRPVYAASQTLSADMTVYPLKSPSVLFLGGAIATGVTRTITISPLLAYPGASFEMRNDVTGLGTLKVAGLSVGGLLSLATGGTSRFFFDSGWKQFS